MKKNFYERTDWLKKFLNPKTQPLLIREYLEKENNFLVKKIKDDISLLDVGCGFGRHLKLLAPKINSAIGIDIDKKRIRESKTYLKKYKKIGTFAVSIENFQTLGLKFDYIICMNNTFGNLYYKKLMALKKMRRLIKDDGKIIISVHSCGAIYTKMRWYKNTGLTNVKRRGNYIYTEEKFRSEFFAKQSLERLFKKAGLKYKILDLTQISYVCILSKK